MKKDKPLAGKRVLVPRARAQALSFAEQIKALGGVPVVAPLITIEPCRESETIRRAIQQLGTYDWLVFTSQNGVEAFFSLIHKEKISEEQIRKLKIAVVGEKTEEPVRKRGYSAHVIPDNAYTAESLVDELLKKIKLGERVFMARGNLARDVLPRTLEVRGFDVLDCIVYETVINEQIRTKLETEVTERRLDIIAFTSPSTVNNFVALLEKIEWRKKLEHACFAAIGPITEQAMHNQGITPDVIATLNTTKGLLEAVVQFLHEKKEGHVHE